MAPDRQHLPEMRALREIPDAGSMWARNHNRIKNPTRQSLRPAGFLKIYFVLTMFGSYFDFIPEQFIQGLA